MANEKSRMIHGKCFLLSAYRLPSTAVILPLWNQPSSPVSCGEIESHRELTAG
jgi:hypothetical protein